MKETPTATAGRVHFAPIRTSRSEIPTCSFRRAGHPVAQKLTAPSRVGWEPKLDRLGFWVLVAIILIVIAYGPFLATYTPLPVSPGFKAF